ncbi:Pepco domain-containing protein [Komarekiella delphini-convector]|uniref:Pepco domain-containing protein n=1 Tax=Komarekiella delphini-convector TaxID=3050158 RepID=UPI001CD87E59|nr:hypothetical protein [Komarekiella delphini-convector]
MSETPSDTIWIVTDETPQISIPEGAKGEISIGRDWRDETLREPTGSKGVGDAVKVSAQKLEQEMTHFLQVVGRLFSHAEQQAEAIAASQIR